MIKLTKKDLVAIGYVIVPVAFGFIWCQEDDKPPVGEILPDKFTGRFCATEDLAIAAATAAITKEHELHRCDNCGELHTDDQLGEARHLSQRVEPGGVYPSGECAICKCLCYPEKDEEVAGTNQDEPLIAFLDGDDSGENLVCMLAPAGISETDAKERISQATTVLGKDDDLDVLTTLLKQQGFTAIRTVTIDLLGR